MEKTQAKILALSTDEIHFLVPSSRDGMHNVVYNRKADNWTCTCEHYEYRGAFCKHMQTAKDLIAELNETVQDCFNTEIHNKNQVEYIKKQAGEI